VVQTAALRRNGGSVGGGCRRGGNAAINPTVAAVTWRTASSKTSSVRSVTAWMPLTFRTYWRAAASISSAVTGGSNPRSVVMFLHMGSV